MQNKEVWKPVKGYEGYYEVSNLGRVKSLDRYVTQINRWGKPMKRFFAGKMLKQAIHKYYFVTLRDGSKIWNITVHRLVAMHFIDRIPNKTHVNHINAIKTDNRVENLEWCTHSENHQHATDLGLRKSGKDNYISKMVLDTETGIFYDTIKDAAKSINIADTTLRSRLVSDRFNRFIILSPNNQKYKYSSNKVIDNKTGIKYDSAMDLSKALKIPYSTVRYKINSSDNRFSTV